MYRGNCLLLYGVNGANFGTGTAIDTGVGVNDVNVSSGGNRGDRALALTRSAANAFVVDFVGHDLLPPYYMGWLFYFTMFEGKCKTYFLGQNQQNFR